TELVPEEARGWVHLGATSQDVLDTALMLQAREGLESIEDELRGVGEACAVLAQEHVATVMPGRTLLQHATPITFGLKAAHWLGAATRQLVHLAELREALPLQFGGAAGTLAALGDEAEGVTERVAAELGLSVPDLPWHTDRDVVAHLTGSLAITAGAMAKIATDVALSMQTEVAEMTEGAQAGAGTSSAMPQKRNPVQASAAIAAARLAAGAASVVIGGLAQEHERGVGSWHAEWVAVPDAFRYSAGAVEHVRAVVEGLQVDPDRMRANIDAGGGLSMAEALVTALTTSLGRDEAFRVVAGVCDRAVKERIDLRGAAHQDEAIRKALSSEEIDAALDPGSSLGSTARFVSRAVERFRDVRGAGTHP
ncbi:MAG: 3-carboxy-cis,cis-muconate cycloisomerase, partial [Actinobacteria bacterium]|nr:3-carboxy-cis,cis-muconate cycloisomerase [Actinomycetota bacterium]